MKNKRIAIATLLIIGIFLLSSIISSAADYFIMDKYGNLIELHEDGPGEYSVVSSYRPFVSANPALNNMVSDNVDTAKGYSDHAGTVTSTMASAVPSGT